MSYTSIALMRDNSRNENFLRTNRKQDWLCVLYVDIYQLLGSWVLGQRDTSWRFLFSYNQTERYTIYKIKLRDHIASATNLDNVSNRIHAKPFNVRNTKNSKTKMGVAGTITGRKGDWVQPYILGLFTSLQQQASARSGKIIWSWIYVI